MCLRCGREQVFTESRISVDTHLRRGGSAAFQSKRVAPVFGARRRDLPADKAKKLGIPA